MIELLVVAVIVGALVGVLSYRGTDMGEYRRWLRGERPPYD